MTRQYLRNVSVSINGVSITSDGNSGPRIRFDVHQMTTSTPAHANIIVSNLKPETINKMRKEGGPVTVSAGYADGPGKIFEGQILQVRTLRESITDTTVHVLATDSSGPRNFAVVNKALAAGHTYDDRVTTALDAFSKLGVSKGYIDQLSSRKFPRNFVAHGMAADLLREVCRANDAHWFIRGGKLNILKTQNTIPGNTHIINAKTGMVWLPEQTISGVVVRCLLDNTIGPGDKIQLNNSSIQEAAFDPSLQGFKNNEQFRPGGLLALTADGIYKAWVVEHIGDTRGNEFYTNITCVSTDAGNPSLLGAGQLGPNTTLDVPSEVDQVGGS